MFLRNPRQQINLYFLLFSVSISLWIFTNAIFRSLPLGAAYYDALLSYSAALLLATFLALFLRGVAGDTGRGKTRLYLLVGVGSAILSLIPGLLSTGVSSSYEIATTIWVNLYGFILVMLMLGGVVPLVKARKKVSTAERQRINTILFGFAVAIVVGVLFNLVLPLLTGSYSYVQLGPLGGFIVVLTSGYSIIKHKLFDMRLIVARSLAYVILVAAVAVVYAAILSPFVGFLSEKTELTNSQMTAIYTTFAVFLALTFQPIKKFIDKATHKIFFRDAYDTQEVLDRVSGVIVGSVDPHKVQKGSLVALGDALRPAHMTFLLFHGANSFVRGDGWGQRWSMHNPVQLKSVLARAGKKMTIYDEIEDQGSKLRQILRLEDISIVAPLMTKDEIIGYLIVGPKKTGNIYNSQDVGLLNIATNELAVALQNAQRFEEIQAFNTTLQNRVTEATRELKSTNKKLVALDEAKDEFISMASHQLRTPLTSIKGYISMILEGDLGKVNQAQEKALKEAFGSSQRMVYLIADFLNVSRIKTGKFMIEPKEVDLPNIVSEEITQLREMASSRDLKVEYEQPAIFPRVMLDDNKIRQVMMNMVDNAIYYTPSGGTITIQLFSDGDEVFFKVKDTGIGVPKREQHKLFTKFYRAGNARKARPDGTGLGLFMAQKIVVEQGGAIIFESAEGKGSTFGFRFPLKKIQAKS